MKRESLFQHFRLIVLYAEDWYPDYIPAEYLTFAYLKFTLKMHLMNSSVFIS